MRVRCELASEESGVALGDKVPENYKSDESGEQRPPVQRTVTIEGIDENRASLLLLLSISLWLLLLSGSS